MAGLLASLEASLEWTLETSCVWSVWLESTWGREDLPISMGRAHILISAAQPTNALDVAHLRGNKQTF